MRRAVISIGLALCMLGLSLLGNTQRANTESLLGKLLLKGHARLQLKNYRHAPDIPMPIPPPELRFAEQRIHLLEKLRNQSIARVLSPNKKWAVTTKYASYESVAPPVVALWRLPGWHRVGRLSCGTLEQGLASRGVRKIVFSPDSRTVAVAYGILQRDTTFPSGVDSGRVIFWNTTAGRKQRVIEVADNVDDVQFSPDGKTVFIAHSEWHDYSSGLNSVDVASGRDVSNKVNLPNPREDQLQWQKLSPGGKWLAQDIGDRLQIIRVATGKQETLLSNTSGLDFIGFSPDSSALIYMDAAEKRHKKQLPVTTGKR